MGNKIQNTKYIKEPFKELQSQISYREVEEALKRMKREKGVGGDKISMEMIQGGGEILWHNIHALLQCCWEEEYSPEDSMERREGMRLI